MSSVRRAVRGKGDQVSRRSLLQAILRDPAKRRALMVSVIIATQAREGIETTQEQAERAYDAVQRTRNGGS